jgi:hypothetical protein
MHDRNGTPIQVGDVVLVKAKVTSVSGGVDYCNASLSVGFDKEHGADNIQTSLSVNTRQVVLYDRPAE